jgi:pectate lyase
MCALSADALYPPVLCRRIDTYVSLRGRMIGNCGTGNPVDDC